MNYKGGMWEGGSGQDGVEWGVWNWDNCNSIINKYIFFKENIMENFPNLTREIDFQEVQVAQRVPKRDQFKEAHTKAHHNYITQD